MTADVSHFFYSSSGLRANEIGGSITAEESHLGGGVGGLLGWGGEREWKWRHQLLIEAFHICNTDFNLFFSFVFTLIIFFVSSPCPQFFVDCALNWTSLIEKGCHHGRLTDSARLYCGHHIVLWWGEMGISGARVSVIQEESKVKAAHGRSPRLCLHHPPHSRSRPQGAESATTPGWMMTASTAHHPNKSPCDANSALPLSII